MPSCLLSDVSPCALFWMFSSSRCRVCIWPHIVCLFFLVLSVWRTCFASFPFLHTPASLGLWSGLCLGFSLPVCPPCHSSPSRFLSARARRSLWISAAAGYCRLAATLPCWLGRSWTGLRAVQADYLLAVYAVRLIFWDWVFSVFIFNKFEFIHLLLDPGLVSDSMYKSLVFGDEFLAQGLHLQSHQRC